MQLQRKQAHETKMSGIGEQCPPRAALETKHRPPMDKDAVMLPAERDMQPFDALHTSIIHTHMRPLMVM